MYPNQNTTGVKKVAAKNAGNSNILWLSHHYQKFKFHQQQETLAIHFDFTSVSARPFFRFLATTFFTPGVFWLGLIFSCFNQIAHI